MWGASAKLLSDNGLREGGVRLWDRGVRGNKGSGVRCQVSGSVLEAFRQAIDHASYFSGQGEGGVNIVGDEIA